MGNEVVMMVGSPASGKGRAADLLVTQQKYVHLNRDKVGGKVADLLPAFMDALGAGRSVVLDNTYPTAEKRKPFIDMAKRFKTPIRCMFMGTSTEDCSINALMRMWDRYGKLFLSPNDLSLGGKAADDPNMFPIAALFSYKKEFQEPKTSEGFTRVEKVSFKRIWPVDLTGKGLVLDFDDTLRSVKPGAKFKFPTTPSEIDILPRRREVLKAYQEKGYQLLGASNQSGIARQQLSAVQAEECFLETCERLGQKSMPFVYCPHNVPPICYCRKPQSGMGVYWIRKMKLNPSQTIYVGDQTTDKTFATRLGFQYVDQSEFFK